MKEVQLLFLMVLISNVMFCGKNEPRATELTTFFDFQEENPQLVVYDLKNQYTAHVIRSIVFETLKNGYLPAHTKQTFDKLLAHPPNFIDLHSFFDLLFENLESSIQPTEQNNFAKARELIFEAYDTSCNKHYELESQQQKKLNRLLLQDTQKNFPVAGQ